MGALPSSGPISISQISQELVNSSKSLRTLSADAGKSTPDSISEFRGYQLPTSLINLQQNNPFLENVDSYGMFVNTSAPGGPNFEYVGPFGDLINYNTEGGTGTFLTNGGASAVTVHGRWSFTVYSFSNTYGPNPTYPIYSYINLSGVGRVANANCPAGFMEIYYTFTTTPGATYSFNFGLDYGSV